MEHAIVIKGVRKTFGTKVAVSDLDLVVKRGGLCGFIGPNGAGKTTTIRMIMSILFPDQGEISVLGKPSAIESKDRIGYLPEERGVYRKMKVGAFLNYMARLKGIDSGASDRKVREWLGRMSLGETYKKKCEELSKGMQQKVQFISAVIHEPELIILDEVFTGLDPLNRALMRQLIDEQHQRGCTIIFSTHAMFEAEQLCQQIFMIHQGVKMLDGTLAEIVARFDPRALLVELVDPASLGALSRIPGVVRAEPMEGAASSGLCEVRLDEGLPQHEGMKRIVDALPVNRVQVKRASLEDVFIELVLRTQGGGSSGNGKPLDRAALRMQIAAAASSGGGGGES